MAQDYGPYRKALTEDKSRYENFVRSWEKKIGSLLEFRLPGGDAPASSRKNAASGPPSLLEGLPFAVKNNIAIKDWKLTCGSKMLSGLVSPYTATAVARLEAAGARVVATTNLDEFGMGSSTENSALQRTNNPWDAERVPGGSSGGSAAAVASGIVPFALGSDTGGSVRQPAAFCGAYGLKPTYGSVSRYGLVAYASSLEVIGLVARDVDLAEAAYRAMRGSDPMDQTSLDHPDDAPGLEPGAAPPPKRVAVIGGEGLEPEVAEALRDAAEALRAAGAAVETVDLPVLDYAVPAYYTIAAAEASANLARFNGIRYGLRPYYAENPDELVLRSRTDGFGPEVKLRVMLGTYVLRSGFQEQYYVRAQKIRTAIKRGLDAVFEKADLILCPVFPTRAFKRGDASMDSFAQKRADVFTVTANLAGIPALSFPAGVRGGLPAGLQFMAPVFGEKRIFAAARLMAGAFPPEACPGSSFDRSAT
jgi:aspartyl-tRNA(Asn)/glutamyl-tRNA(Gln) amidotransferase subunit A